MHKPETLHYNIDPMDFFLVEESKTLARIVTHLLLLYYLKRKGLTESRRVGQFVAV